ncbi:homocysteine S-methyltransferase family protein [Sedimentitalea arenosa]|uniref:Homocysteine S-methyltransferase family protein n=1 Tax=Sedimentitalea arenosa TaxID=2798803 RepID=A0A8J7IU75_9RHOB|nr:homocysteine S-methyltransferase family protein [Arenibacterium arenosum]MBJ6372856.1 homocysteine S-methyltransferase family protein [Arenibacterium arenosum]
MTDITLLDGSIGQELVKRSGNRATPLWSTRVMIDQPDLVGAVHSDYFAVGATVATTNTYAVHRSRLVRVGLEDEVPALLDTAMAQAEMARGRYGGRIAGSLGPLLASYRPDLNPDPDEAALKFGELVQLMCPRVDLFLIESVSSVREAIGALRATQDCGKPVWIALTVQDDDGTRLRSGEPLTDLAGTLELYAPEAVLLNCSRPEAVTQGMPTLPGFGRPFGGYANGFERISQEFLKDSPTVDALKQRVDLSPSAYADHAMAWVELGATIVGGCCEVGPDHIAELARRLRAAGHRIV